MAEDVVCGGISRVAIVMVRTAGWGGGKLCRQRRLTWRRVPRDRGDLSSSPV